MTIKIGDKLPAVEFISFNADGLVKLTTDQVFAGKKVVLFAVPGAFTPTCSMNHLPGFIEHADAIKAKGVDTIACTAVNDHHVMKAWSKHSGADGKILMLADDNNCYVAKNNKPFGKLPERIVRHAIKIRVKNKKAFSNSPKGKRGRLAST